MNIDAIIAHLETIAPPVLQEAYDNAGLITGRGDWACTGVLTTLDATEAVVLEAVSRGCNLIVAHHPIVFGGLKKINGKNYVEKAIITAIKNDIAIYAIHTNLDNVLLMGVNSKIAERLQLVRTQILQPKEGLLQKLVCFVPHASLDKVRDAIFAAGAGHVGNYSECSFGAEGTGTFKGGEGTLPFVGKPGTRHEEHETRLEVILPAYISQQVVKAMILAHPYEEVAYDLISLANLHQGAGSGLIGELREPLSEMAFLARIKEAFGLSVIRHTPLRGKPVSTVALCGGAGSFLISKALAAGADFYVTADVKYHEFFDANDRLVLADIGHFESEQFTIELLFDILQEKFRNFAILKSDTKTNPVNYYLG